MPIPTKVLYSRVESKELENEKKALEDEKENIKTRLMRSPSKCD